MVKGQRGHGVLRPEPHTPSNLPPENCQRSQEVIQTRSPRSCSHISIEADEREPVTLHPLSPPRLTPVSLILPPPPPPVRPSMLLVLTCCEVITTCCSWNSGPQIPAKSIRASVGHPDKQTDKQDEGRHIKTVPEWMSRPPLIKSKRRGRRGHPRRKSKHRSCY